jgi:DNA modification methylase/DNA-directed RNA polymerase subunit RPC12/RpoP
MERRKLTKQDIDKVRHIEGFPIAKDEDIIALSDPPYYTACPNPFIEDFIKEHGKPYDEETDDYHREPFAADVSEGKNDPIYSAHSYHTKVPHKAVMRYILHYTDPGDIVLDGFCGTGMTGVAAQMCGNPDANFKYQIEQEMPYVTWGARKAVLSDLSPAATFIAYNYNTPVDVHVFQKEARRILQECKDELGWMYETQHVIDGEVQLDITGKPMLGHINYTVWSDVFICPSCGKDFIFWDVAVDKITGKVRRYFCCPHCNSRMQKQDCTRAQASIYDLSLNKVIQQARLEPVLINYSIGKQKYEIAPDELDYKQNERLKNLASNYWHPTAELPDGHNTEQPKKSHGVTCVHHFYSRRNLAVLATFWAKSLNSKTSHSCRCALLSLVTGVIPGVSKLQRFRLFSTFPNMILTGTLYISSTTREWNPLDWIAGKLRSMARMKSNIHLFNMSDILISTNSATNLCQPENSIDYIFTDPPFGANINYSEISFLWEAWLNIITNQVPEAIINQIQGKELLEYQNLMSRCFAEYYRVLKPGRWMTVEFHNSKNAVWNAIQESLQRAGFIVADVRTLDKKQGSFKQITSTSAVKQDLIISAYKPKDDFVKTFNKRAGNPEAAFDFVRQHLEKLPVTVINNGRIEIINERQAYLLFDRMVAYHIINGLSVPLDAHTFYQGLDERFMLRDGMYFLPSQVNEYDTARIVNELEPVQMAFLVTNERSAINWLYHQLRTPQTYGELQPKFMQEQRAIARFEDLPELQVLLDENFLQDDKGRWYIPDVTKEGDLAKLRNKNLLKEFNEYLATKGKLRLFRLEAIRAGFAKLWDDKNYQLIVDTAERLPESVVQEDDKLLMYYDISLGRL